MAPRRKRAPGGGRKPKGAFSKLTSPLSIRMPGDMRDELEAAAKASGKSVSQELLRRLQNSFYRDRDKARDPAMQALCFLIAETAQQTAGLNNRKDGVLDWRTNPFYFRAFKIAVGNLLDALEPKGKIEPPIEMQFSVSEEARSLESDFLKSFRDPESRGAYAARSIWASLRNIPLHTREDEAKRLRERSEAAYLRELYGMPNAARDLQIEIEEDKS
jgi:hypothetical protein